MNKRRTSTSQILYGARLSTYKHFNSELGKVQKIIHTVMTQIIKQLLFLESSLSTSN